ncbi:hypothetical protein JHL17_30295 [Azospirillum sp. YIM B02556]|uniref:Uncharacterized protein n=1 Tax=Azospirillum endophyticum TaxID=2800326 RepID=A0ABS1FED1_9PROT|nr:hypothetical protein [Azospirillum endophyticum]MBK1841698.1 hypothetical protein [Azospirillum endophyticum]
MADHHRSNDSRDLDAQDLADMTRAFLAKGGNIVQCPPGASENVVYRKGGFRRRNPNDVKTAAETPAGAVAETVADAGSADINAADINAVDANPADTNSADAGTAVPAAAAESKAG